MKTIMLKNKVRVTDPCYDDYVWCAGTLTNVKPGEYVCKADYAEGRVASIEVIHKDYESKTLFWHEADFEVGVDSGQAGIFDYDDFMAHVNERLYDSGDWYDQCCKLTLSKDKCGVINGVGFVGSSGWGDGVYTCFIAKNEDGQIVGIQIDFIDYEDWDDYEDEWPEPNEDDE